MPRIMGCLDKLPDFVTRRSRLCLGLGLLVAFGFGAFAPFVQTVNNVDYFTLEDHPDTLFYEELKKVFGNDEFFVIAFQKPDLFSKENLQLIKEVTEKLENLPGVREVLSLANVNETRGGEGFFEVHPFLEEIPESQEALQELRSRALSNPLYVRQILSQDATTTAIVVFPDDRPEDPDHRKRLLSATERILEPYRSDGTSFHLAGWTVMNVSLSQYMKDDLFRFIPITYLLIGLTIHWIFRRFQLTLLALLNISACLTATMGFFPMAGITLHNVTVIVPPLVMALSLSDTVHIFSHLEINVLHSAGNDRRRALNSVLARVIRPSFLTTLTTFVGFLSLAVSPIPPIRDFAWTASLGMVFEFFFAFVLLPPLILLFPPENLYIKDREKRTMMWILEATRRLVLNHPKTLVTGGVFLMLAGAFLAQKIRVETNLLDYFKPSDPLRRSFTFVEQNLAGVGSFDVSVNAHKTDAFKDPGLLRYLEALQARGKALDGVDTSLSLVDFLKDMNKAFHQEHPDFYRLPEKRDLIAQYLLLYDPKDLKAYVNDSYSHARVTFRLSEHRSSAQAEILQRMREFAESQAPEGVTVRLSGRAVHGVNTTEALVSGQTQSLALAILVIWPIMIIALRSWKLGLLSLIPNLFPLALNFGLMGLLDIPLNTATAIIAAVAIGMVVDNTIHFIGVYVENRSSGLTPSQSLSFGILTKGQAMTSSTLILLIGFGVSVLSHFVPTIHFGFLSVMIMLSALAGDLLFLPALILCLQVSGQPRVLCHISNTKL
ncbi:MAG: MMPL family transporter [Desulfosoma sp.]